MDTRELRPAQTANLKLIGSFLILFSVSIFLAGLGCWLKSETHDSVLAIDRDWYGRHVCPYKINKSLENPLPYAPNRPDENFLWQQRLISEKNDDENRLRMVNKEFYTNAQNEYKIEMANLLKDELHYRVEVRRTILEIEAKHPVKVNPIFANEGDSRLLLSTSLAIHSECDVGYPHTQAAHDRGRSDAVVWYLRHGIFPVNYKKVTE